MIKKSKKYVLRESELKEIITEMVMTELYDPNLRKANLQNGQITNYHMKDLGGDIFGALKKLPAAVLNTIDPNYAERIQNGDNEFARQVLSILAASPEGTTGGDWFPDLRSLKVFGGNGFGQGNNFDAKEVFNPRAAATYLMSIATPTYIRGKNGWCARAVRMALQNGGLQCPWGMNGRHAANYVTILKSNGWREINQSQAGAVGDVVVIEAFQGHPYGHIAMCCGNGRWYSDFRQNSMVGLAGGAPPALVHVFRYTNIAGQSNVPPTGH